jgi:AraC family transcriptional regulator of adaptative response / DNA-3-methyladenine glycosylase II
MMSDEIACYKALVARDARFDGLFFVGVTSTSVYCRPICPVKTPKEINCRFFTTAFAAEKAGFRPCLRCRPELAPGNAPMDSASRIAQLLVERVAQGLISNSGNIEAIAEQFDLSSRQLRRIVQKELGVSPLELIQTRRLLLAKQLLTETQWPITDIAYASGFSSLRRFNEAFNTHYRMSPSRLRKDANTLGSVLNANDTSTLQLTYRDPYDWQGLLNFLRTRMLKGVEWITDDTYYRTVRLGEASGWIAVNQVSQKRTLSVTFSNSLASVLPALLGRLRNLFDLNARPDLIAQQLGQDPILQNAVANNPGLRVPGAFDGFELAMRAILGQQVSVKAATTLACRLVDTFGKPLATPHPALGRLAPSAALMARAQIEDITGLGITRTRARSIIELAQAYEAGALCLESGANPEQTITRLNQLPGIGPWTANYIAMRALNWPDAFLKSDIVIRNNLGGVTSRQAEVMSQAWQPWRSYAVLHIWNAPQQRLIADSNPAILKS